MKNYIRLACVGVDGDGTDAEAVIRVSGPGMNSKILSKVKKRMKSLRISGYSYPDIFGAASEVLEDEGYTVDKIITVFNVEV